jgi:hypothetical protein
MTMKQRITHDNFSATTIRLWATGPQNSKRQRAANARYQLHHQIE